MDNKDFDFEMTDKMKKVGKSLTLKELLSLAMIEAGFESVRIGSKFNLKCVVDMKSGDSYQFSLSVGAEEIKK